MQSIRTPEDRFANLPDFRFMPRYTEVADPDRGLIGLRVLAENPDRFARVVAANTGLPIGADRMPDAFLAWQRYSQETPSLNIARIVNSGCTTDLSPEVLAAYDPPFPGDAYKEGARILPSLVPCHPDDPATPAQRAAWDHLRQWDRPFLTAFSDSDPNTRSDDRLFQSQIPGAQRLEHPRSKGPGTSSKKTTARTSPRSLPTSSPLHRPTETDHERHAQRRAVSRLRAVRPRGRGHDAQPPEVQGGFL